MTLSPFQIFLAVTVGYVIGCVLGYVLGWFVTQQDARKRQAELERKLASFLYGDD